MASVTFSGTTVWNDATTGVGRVSVRQSGGTRRWITEELPGGDGGLLKNNGRRTAIITVVCQYFASSSQQTTIKSGWLDLRGSYGSLVTPAGEGTSTLTNCALLEVDFARSDQVEDMSGNVDDIFVVTAQFQKLRWGDI